MNPAVHLTICSRDAALRQRLTGYLSARAQVRSVEGQEELERLAGHYGSAVILLDLRNRECLLHLSAFMAAHPLCVIIAMGEPRSEPMLAAENLGVFSCEPLDAEREHLQSVVGRASDYLSALLENEILREEAGVSAHRPPAAPAEESRSQPRWQLRNLSQALRKIEKLDALLEATVENVAASALVSRAGLFYRPRDGEVYRLRAGLRCLEETARLEYPARDPLVRWLAIHDHLVSRSNLEHIRPAAERHMLKQALDEMGAEAILPLHARGRVLGWLFVGHRATGIPFETADLENLSELADHVSTVLENALLYEEVAVQKTLAETLLHSMPTGIVAVGLNGVVRWFNTSAQHILGVSPNKVLNNPLRSLGSRLADILQRTLEGAPTEKPLEWVDPLTRRFLAVQSHRLMNGDACLGAVALVQDLTVERLLEEKKDQLERAAFWTELAASMSHEVRNPLVAIKTFAQLLPERFNDPEFRADFSRHVTAEVDRLNGIIEQINAFAHPPQIKMQLVALREAVAKGVKLACQRHPQHGIVIESSIPDRLPFVVGDESALAECFAHLVVNAMEAVEGKSGGRIDITAKAVDPADLRQGVCVVIRDNGRGIPADARDKVFSPFYTTKARGMGLGLPIVRRTIVDHNGRVNIESGSQGTTVSVLLPGGRELERSEVNHEADIGR
jgi:nitrogen-specific signal transduction histidine kinase